MLKLTNSWDYQSKLEIAPFRNYLVVLCMLRTHKYIDVNTAAWYTKTTMYELCMYVCACTVPLSAAMVLSESWITVSTD